MADLFTIKITNVVVQSRISISINLHEFIYKIRDGKFMPPRFSGLIWNHKKIGGCCLLFSNGKLICHGGSSFNQARIRVRKYARLIQKTLNESVRLHAVKLVTASLLADLHIPVNLHRVSQCYPGASYEPELLNAATCRRGRVHFTIFSSGKIVVTGIRDTLLINTVVQPTLMDLFIL